MSNVNYVRLCVFATTLTAMLATATVVVLYPSAQAAPISTLILLGVIATSAEKLRIPQSNGGYASFASWLLIAAVFISPSWPAIATAAGATMIMQVIAGRAPIKAVFNIAATTLSIACAILVFRTVGGVAFPALDAPGWLASAIRTSQIDGVPAVLTLLTQNVVQLALVSGVLAVAQGKHPLAIWKSGFQGTFRLSLLSIPIIPWFAWQATHAGILVALVPATVLVAIWILLVKQAELDRTHQDLLTLMVSSIEARDPYTSGHSQRVQKYSTIIGRALNLTSDELERLAIAALLHDVGKAHPKHTGWLKKPGALTRDELLVMQEHPQDGANLIAVAKTLGDLVRPILHHHENWDGSGFPKLLGGADIPLFSRIIRVADAIDAMTTTRPYKAKKNPDQVKNELIEFQGTWFDPEIVSTLLSSPQWITLRREIDRNEISGPRNFGLTPRPHLRRVSTGFQT
jgi:HD-GYP domain-containing protein (c-di-GMP phosphodiesterase class II)